MSVLWIVALCLASAVLGRLMLTFDEARRSITVRLPALLQLLAWLTITLLFLVIVGLACFIGGSFYGLYAWWLPRVASMLEDEMLCELVSKIIFGQPNP